MGMDTINQVARVTDLDSMRVSRPMEVARLKMAYGMAEMSGDRSTKNGAVIFDPDNNLMGVGWNGIIPGVDITEERLTERPLKYKVINHAEDSAIFEAARAGNCLDEATLYCPWYACDRCAAAIIRSGIRRVVGHYDIFDRNPRWDLDLPFQMLDEAGVVMELIKGRLGIEAFMDGEWITV